MKKANIGIIGCGAIGSAIAKAVPRKFSRYARVAYVCDLSKEKAANLCCELGSSASVCVTSINQLIRNSDIVVEAASASISAEVVRRALKYHKKVLILSVAGLLQIKNLFDLMKRSRGRVWIPSGAVTGVDGLIAACQAEVRCVRLVTRKPPEGLQGAPYFFRRKFPSLRPGEERCVFKGSALSAVRAFPQNINVAALLSLAGIGPQKTKVEIWTSRKYRLNQHEVCVEGDFGTMKTVTANIPSPENPKTSYLAILSAIAVLKEIFSCIEIGT